MKRINHLLNWIGREGKRVGLEGRGRESDWKGREGKRIGSGVKSKEQYSHLHHLHLSSQGTSSGDHEACQPRYRIWLTW